jgi:Tfp pilus assembly protein PilF
LKINDLESAVRDITKALEINEDDKLAYQFRAEVLTKLNKAAEAQVDLNRAKK